MEDIALDLQSGVRRWVLVVVGVAVVFAYPSYLLGVQLSSFWFQSVDVNSKKYDKRDIVSNRKIIENEVVVDSPSVVDLNNGQRVIYTFLDNRQNRNIGYNPFVYQIQIVDKQGDVLTDETRKTYLLPGEAKYISATTTNQDAASLLVKKLPESSYVEYNPEASDFLKTPELEVREQRVAELDKNNLSLKISIKNTTNLIIKDLDIIMLIRDSQDSIIGVQDYKISGFLPDQNRDVNITYPKSKTRTARSLDVRYSVNYLQKDSLRLR
jgi:hypothetical protein